MKSFMDDIATVLDLDKIINGTIELLDKTLHPETSIILLAGNGKYLPQGVKDDKQANGIGNDSKIALYLKSTKEIINIESENDKSLSADIKNDILKYKAVLAVPLTLRDELIGIMLLGKKKSDENYTPEDLSILVDLARTEAIGIKNAQLTKIIADKSEQRGIDKTSVGAAHQMKNILAEIYVDTETIHFALQHRFSNFDELTLEKAKNFMAYTKAKVEKILKQTERGTGALNAILYPAKAQDGFTTVGIPLLIKQALTTASQVKSKDFLEKNIPLPGISNNVPDDFFEIVGNEKLLEQIFINLINNAYDAILWAYMCLNPGSAYLGKITINAADSGESVVISVEDNGIGMKDETKDKLFAGFFTTKSVQGKGHGAGLYTMHDWIVQHNGSISFTSEYGKGTTFKLVLPKQQGDQNGPKIIGT